MKEVQIILSESQNAKPYEESQMIHQIEFDKVKKLIAKQVGEADSKHTEVHHAISVFGERGTGKTSFLDCFNVIFSNRNV